jgi:hypothetical protein
MSQRDKDRETANSVFNEIWRGVPTPPPVDPIKAKILFPHGLRYHYFQSVHRRMFWDFSWSTTKNMNGKFVSWIERPKGGRHTWRRAVEHKRRKDAKARAWRLMVQFDAKGKK